MSTDASVCDSVSDPGRAICLRVPWRVDEIKRWRSEPKLELGLMTEAVELPLAGVFTSF